MRREPIVLPPYSSGALLSRVTFVSGYPGRTSFRLGGSVTNDLSTRVPELLIHPLLEGVEILRTPEERLHQVRPRLRPARLYYRPPISHGGLSAEQIRPVKLAEKIQGDDLVQHIGVIVRRVSH